MKAYIQQAQKFADEAAEWQAVSDKLDTLLVGVYNPEGMGISAEGLNKLRASVVLAESVAYAKRHQAEKNAIIWTPQRVKFLQKNFDRMTNRQLSDALGLKLTSVRTKCYELGLKHMEMEYWTKRQVNYLVRHYREMGDTELAENFSQKWYKEKGWSKKHIEKKRRYMNLKRTTAEKKLIKERNRKTGCWAIGNVHMWETRGVTPIGELRIWNVNGRPIIVIRTETGFKHYARWLWTQKRGKVKRGYVIRVKDPSKNITLRNLEMISRAENGIRNRRAGLAYPDELRQAIKILNKLNKTIKHYEKQN